MDTTEDLFRYTYGRGTQAFAWEVEARASTARAIATFGEAVANCVEIDVAKFAKRVRLATLLADHARLATDEATTADQERRSLRAQALVTRARKCAERCARISRDLRREVARQRSAA
tara:strand:- start:5357 stop:5707 length:351 start_codon:yes stop_codon:yes gene_type:complete